MANSWYEVVEGASLEQGDLLYNFPVVKAEVTAEHVQQLLADETPELEADVQMIDAIIMTQSCDLANDKTDTLTLCPIWDNSRLEFGKSKLNEIRRGRRFEWHLLNQCEDLDVPYTPVEFSRLFTAKKSAVVEFTRSSDQNLRLASPYKEHFSQAFARYFMRVGLPADIPQF